MWDRIHLRSSVEKVYGRLKRLSLTMYECVGMIAYNHLEKVKIIKKLKEELTNQQREMKAIEVKMTEIKDSLLEESELADSIFCLSKDISSLTKRSSQSLEYTESLMMKEEQNSSDIWKTIHGEKVLLHESIYLLGKTLKKDDIHEIEEYEKRVVQLMKEISTMIQQKEANPPNK